MKTHVNPVIATLPQNAAPEPWQVLAGMTLTEWNKYDKSNQKEIVNEQLAMCSVM